MPGRPKLFGRGVFCSIANTDAHCGRCCLDTCSAPSVPVIEVFGVGLPRLVASLGYTARTRIPSKMGHDFKDLQSWTQDWGC